MNKVELNSLNKNELKEFMKNIGEQPFRGDQIFNYIHKNKGDDIKEIKTLSKALREKLDEEAYINKLRVYERFDSKLDGTRKYLFLLEDENIIESVLMRYKHGNTVCISTQIGCRMGCNFCASTKDGLIRNLTPGEMLEQIYRIEEDLDVRVSNVVLMGSGEPFDNYDNVLKFIELLTDEEGKNMSMRNITLSTCGIVPKIYELAGENLPLTLAISLHSTKDRERSEMMPIAKKYSIDEIMEAAEYYIDKTGRRVTFEYTLIDGINDSARDAEDLVRLFRGLNIHLNLIPLNPIEEYEETYSKKDKINKFKNILDKNGIQVTLRREMGRDISASCGQLRRSVLDL